MEVSEHDDKSLGGRGVIFESMYERALAAYDTDRAESERLARLLLSYADLGDWHKAGCHHILACGSDNYVWHAKEAVKLYEGMYTMQRGSSWRQDGDVSGDLLADQRSALEESRRTLARATKDSARVQRDYTQQFDRFKRVHGREPTDNELATAHMATAASEIDEHLNNQHEMEEDYLAGSGKSRAAAGQTHTEAGGSHQAAASLEEDDDDLLGASGDEGESEGKLERKPYKPVPGGLGWQYGIQTPPSSQRTKTQ